MKEYIKKLTLRESRAVAADSVIASYNDNKICVVSFINAHSVNLAENDMKFKDALLSATLLFRDGIGLKFLLKLFNVSPGENLNGTDLIPIILGRLKSKSLITIGTQEPFLSRANIKLSAQGLNIVGSLDGFRTFEEMLQFINGHKPDVLLLGMGMPKQELFSQYLAKRYSGRLLIINGGAILDFYGDKVTRAPYTFRNLGLEWLYRLFIEPKRLFRRYVVGNPVFIARLLYARYFKSKI